RSPTEQSGDNPHADVGDNEVGRGIGRRAWYLLRALLRSAERLAHYSPALAGQPGTRHFLVLLRHSRPLERCGGYFFRPKSTVTTFEPSSGVETAGCPSRSVSASGASFSASSCRGGAASAATARHCRPKIGR